MSETLLKGLRAQRPLISGPVSTSASAFIIPGRFALLCPPPMPPLPPAACSVASLPLHMPYHLLLSPTSVSPPPRSVSIDIPWSITHLPHNSLSPPLHHQSPQS